MSAKLETADQYIFIPATSQYFVVTQPFIHCLLPLNGWNETACIKSAISQPLTIPLHWSCFPSSSPLPYFAGCVLRFVCHYSWHFPCITFICQTLVVTSFRALLQFHCRCHFRLYYLSSLSTLDTFLNKSIVIHLWRLNKLSCLQPWFNNVVGTFRKNETLRKTSSRFYSFCQWLSFSAYNFHQYLSCVAVCFLSGRFLVSLPTGLSYEWNNHQFKS